MSEKLSELAEIMSGYTFRGAVIDAGHGVRVIQAKDVSTENIDFKALPFVNDDIPANKYLQDGDVLLTSRGSFRAAVYRSDVPSVASSSLFVLRSKTDKCLPEYLSIFLNSERSQSYLNQSARGATIKSVRIPDLGVLDISVLSINKQKQLAEFSSVIKELTADLHRKSQLISDIHSATFNKVLQGAR